MAKQESPIPKEILQAYEELVSQFPDVERKGKKTPYTSLNGHMFSFLSQEGDMGLRLSTEDRESYIKECNSQLMEQHGRVMKEFVLVSRDSLQQDKTMPDWFRKSHEYTASLKPKPSKKKK